MNEDKFVPAADFTSLKCNNIAALLNESEDNPDYQAYVDAGVIAILIKGLNSNNTWKLFAKALLKFPSQFIPDIIDAGILTALIELFNSSLEAKREFAVNFASYISFYDSKAFQNNTEILLNLVILLNDKNVNMVKCACEVIGRIGGGEPENESYNNDGKNAVIQAGAIPKLVKLLSSDNINLIKKSTKALVNISFGNSAHKQAIINANAIPPLIKLLSSSNIKACRNASMCFINLAQGLPTQRKVIIDAGVIPHLIQMITVSDKEEDININRNVIYALYSISMEFSQCKGGKFEIQAIIDSSGAIKNIIKLLSASKEKEIIDLTFYTLRNIIVSSKKASQHVFDEGIIPKMLQFLQSSKKSENFIENILKILFDISSKHPEAIIECKEMIFQLVECIKFKNPKIHATATIILTNLVCNSFEGREVVIDANVFSPLFELFKSYNFEICGIALDVIYHIAVGGCEEHRQAILKANTLQAIVEFCDLKNLEIFKQVIKVFTIVIRGITADERCAVECLLKQLENEDPEMQKLTAYAIKHIAVITIDQDPAIINPKALFSLVKLLKSSNINVVFHASEAICHLISCKNITPQILCEANVIPSFLQLLEKYSTNDHMCAHAIGGLRNIAFRNVEFKELIIKEKGIIPLIIKFLEHSDSEKVLQAAGTIVNLIAETSEQRQIVIDAGAARYIEKLLFSSDTRKCKEALYFFNNITTMGSKEQFQNVVTSKVIEKIRLLFESPNVDIAKYAAIIHDRIIITSTSYNS